MNDIANRRPLKSRGAAMAQKTAQWLSRKNITPNHISLASVAFAALCALCLFLLPLADPARPGFWNTVLPILAAVFIQCRLLCNLFDGMVAVEGGKGTPSGELFNDIPDRFADPLILVAAGYATTFSGFAPVLGWLAALLAIMTAYIRNLAVAIGAPADFSGPMAKQHRMAVMTVACLLTAFEAHWRTQGLVLFIALLIIVTGSAWTAWRRMHNAYKTLENPRSDTGQQG